MPLLFLMSGPTTHAVSGAVRAAARALRNADALLVTAGAGIGVDSGLPDFRGVEGLWRAYPPLRGRNLGFSDMANPGWFQIEPNFAWGFYGHRLNLYRSTVPHRGFTRLMEWGETLHHGVRVFTSNVDGQFQKAGFPSDHVCECHGSIHWLQTLDGGNVWSADGVELPDIDAEILSIPDSALPRWQGTGELARPNILMFGDWNWNGERTERQQSDLQHWLGSISLDRLLVIELGAGSAVPTVRLFGERLARRGAALVRVNTREPEVPLPTSSHRPIGIPLGALDALEGIAGELQS